MDFNKQMPDWKNKGDEPSDELKANGFLAGNKPPANIFNWFWGLTSDAIKELQQKLTDEETTRIEADKNINAVKLSGYEHLAFQKITSNYYVPPKNADGVPDWNYLTTSGYYGLVKSGYLNAPNSNNYFFPLVLAYGTGSLTQIAFAFDGTETYIRRCVYGKWTAWSKINEGGNADTVDGKHATDFAKAEHSHLKGTWGSNGEMYLVGYGSDNSFPEGFYKAPNVTYSNEDGMLSSPYFSGNGSYLTNVNASKLGGKSLTDVQSLIEAKANAQTKNGGFVGGTSANSLSGGAIGISASSTNGGAVGYYAQETDGGFAGGYEAIATFGGAVGSGAKETDGGFAGGIGSFTADGGAIGTGAKANNGFAGGVDASATGGGAVGDGAITSEGFAGGNSAKTILGNSPIDAIQLGTGTNSEPRTLQVYGYKLMTADGYVPFERLTIVSAEQTLTLSAYRASVDYEFSENCKFAQILVTECKNGTTDECVITMPNLSTNKIWFMKPQGVTTNLSIKFKVIEFGII